VPLLSVVALAAAQEGRQALHLSAPENRPLAAPQYRQSLIWVNFARGYAAGDRVDMGHASRSRHVIWVLFGSTACSPRHFRQRETKHPGIVGPQETLLSRRHEGLVHPHRYCRRPQADHVFELRDAVSLNFDLLFTPLQQPAFKTNCFFLNANLFPRLFQRPALRYRHPDFGYFRVFSEASFAN